MSQAGPTNNSGGGGGVTLVPDSGGDVSGDTINVFGYPAGTVPVIETYNDMGDFRIADQTYLSRYVVDPSTTPGLKGTFTTINDAITQAIADGFSILTSIATIYVRPGTYIEDLVFPALSGLNITGLSTCGLNFNTSDVIIQGSITHDSQSYSLVENITLNPPGTDGVIVEDGAIRAFYNNCTLIAGSNSCILFNGNTAPFQALSCFHGKVEASATATAVNFSSCAAFYDCTSSSGSELEGSAKVAYYNCQIGQQSLSDTSAVAVYGCTMIGNITGTSTGTCRAYNTVYLANAPGSPFFNHAGNIEYANCSVSNGSFLYSATPALVHASADQGNVMNSITTATDYTVLTTDYYIGVTDTSVLRTITLPDPATISTDQIFLIKDETGNAGVNAITVDTAAGTIDGAASQPISASWGYIQVKSNGTDYFIINSFQ